MITHTCPRCHATLTPDVMGWHLHQCDPPDDDTDEWEPEETGDDDSHNRIPA